MVIFGIKEQSTYFLKKEAKNVCSGAVAT